MKEYFLSYSRGDQAFALRFAHDLKAAGVDVWVDQLDIGIGQNWDRAVEAAVRGCEGFIIILSPRSVASENVADEVGVAIEGTKQIIPILFETCTVPMRLARVQFIDSRTDYQDALRRCTGLILGDQVGGPTFVANAPAQPEPVVAVAGFSAAALDAIAQMLVVHVGPVARLLVQKAATSARSEAELYQQVAVAIPVEAERQAFLKGVQAALLAPNVSAPSTAQVGSPIPPDLLEKLIPALTAHLGPLARYILTSEARSATGRDELYQRLGTHVPSDQERADLMRKLQAL